MGTLFRFSADADIREVRSLLRRLEKRLGNLRRPMAAIGETVVAQIMDCFEQQQAPDGTPWEKSKRAEAEGGQTLIDSALLRNSYNRRAYPDRVEIGTADVKAGTHNFGALAGDFGQTSSGQPIPFGDIPQRRMVPEEDELDWEEIRGVCLDYLTQGAN